MTSSIALGTYNVHGLDRAGEVGRDLARLNEVGGWALQEVNVSADAVARKGCPAALAAVLPPGRWYGACAAANPLDDSGTCEAQVIVSRWPIDDVRIWPLDHEGSKRRVALAAQLRTERGELLFVNADMEPSFLGPWHGSRLGAASLAKQLAREPSPRVVVCGDFNCAGNLWRGVGNEGEVAEVCKLMASAGLSPAPAQDDAHAYTFVAGWLRLRLDHIFVRGVEARLSVDGQAVGSDHRPLWCRVK